MQTHRLTQLVAAAVVAAALAAPGSAGAIVLGKHDVGGVARSGVFPYVAALVYSGQSALDGQFCGASVISPGAVLTAAHCVHGMTTGQIAVVTGSTLLSDERHGQRTAVAQIVIHPHYSDDSMAHDVAVLLLAHDVAAPPIAVAGRRDAGVDAPGVKARVAGWGDISNGQDDGPDALRWTSVDVRSDRTCRHSYGDDYLRSTMLCAGGNTADPCGGDSGGPLVATGRDGAARQIGIVSFGGDRCGQPGVPGMYARVSSDGAWIQALLATSTRATGILPGVRQTAARLPPLLTRRRRAGDS
ncbi:MAG: serine protease [Actinobacteria bacterium]|nr:MAG: serine protease [Actinomycetota bacterium]